MARLEDPTKGAHVKGVRTDGLIKELGGDLKRALIICDKLESALIGNWFDENNLVIARLDKLSRNEDVQAKLEACRDRDLVVVDEAHKISASFFSGGVKETKRYKLGKLAGRLTRHLLLMTATPHNGKEEDFQLFMALLDALTRLIPERRAYPPTYPLSDAEAKLYEDVAARVYSRPQANGGRI